LETPKKRFSAEPGEKPSDRPDHRLAEDKQSQSLVPDLTSIGDIQLNARVLLRIHEKTIA
jgi:hypothetical protein